MEKPAVTLYTYINRHAGPPNNTKNKAMWYIVKRVVIIYDIIAIEPYNKTVGENSVEHRNVMIL